MAFLWTANNPHAPVRANGRRFWGYPTRNGGTAAIRCIGIHTAETDPSPASAENVARWLRDSAPNPASYHSLVDSDSEVELLPDSAVAFGIASFNTPTVHLSFATRAGWWGRYPAWDDDALDRGARVAARWVRRYNIPLRWITRTQALGGERGFVRHSTMDPSRRSDPGASFPADRFFTLIRSYLTGSEEDPMAWLRRNNWPDWSHGDAPIYATSSTNPRRRVADLTVVEFFQMLVRVFRHFHRGGR